MICKLTQQALQKMWPFHTGTNRNLALDLYFYQPSYLSIHLYHQECFPVVVIIEVTSMAVQQSVSFSYRLHCTLAQHMGKSVETLKLTEKSAIGLKSSP